MAINPKPSKTNQEHTAPSADEKKKKHKKINKDHPEFELTYDMMLGIRTTVSQTESKPFRKLTVADFNEVTRWRFNSEGSSTTPAHQMRDFKFKDYSPQVFRHIRDRFDIKPADYLLGVCGNFQYLEFISNSKSGQFFFYNHNRKFLIKTITQAESKYLRQILEHYYHVREATASFCFIRSIVVVVVVVVVVVGGGGGGGDVLVGGWWIVDCDNHNSYKPQMQ